MTHAGGKFRLPVTVRFADLPEAWTEDFRTDTFTYRVRGAIAGQAPREWTGTQAFEDVEVSGGATRIGFSRSRTCGSPRCLSCRAKASGSS